MSQVTPYTAAADLRLVIRDGSALPECPELHEEAHRFVLLWLKQQGQSEADIDDLEAVDAALAQLRYAEVCKVLHLLYQGMNDVLLLERAAYFERQAIMALGQVPLAAADDGEAPTVFSGGDLKYS